MRGTAPACTKLWGMAAALVLSTGCYEGLGEGGGGEDPGEDGADDGDGDGDGNGDDGNDDGGNGVDADCAEGIAATEAPLRRMTDVQYRNTVEALFDGLVEPADAFPETLGSTPYSSYPEANLVTQLGTEGIMMAAEDVASQAVDNLAAVVPCAGSGDESACADEFIDDFGRRAFRRPLLAEERTLLRDLYDAARVDSDFGDAIGRLIAATLQMPQFVYIVEIGEETDDPGVVRLTDYEVASRLSYFFWDTSPDEELIAAAEAGELRTLEDVEAQARRLLADGRADAMVARFSRQWLQVGTLSVSDKDTTAFPAYDETLAAAMQEELDRFVQSAYRSGEGSLQQLLGSSETSVNAPLAALYGIDSGSTGPDDWHEVSLDDDRRAGVLTLPAVISANSTSTSTSAILRGKMVRTQALCQEMPPPPMDLEVPEFPEDATEREKTEILMDNPTCGGCHALMNPLGLAFENYDAIGAWRDTDERGNPIDASGDVVSGPDGVMGEFDGVPELSQMLAASDNSASCMTTQWMRYVQGRRETPDDACVADALTTHFVDSGYDLQELLVAFTQTDGFRFRRLETEQ